MACLAVGAAVVTKDDAGKVHVNNDEIATRHDRHTDGNRR
jgi:hypothetical protein